MSVRVPKSLLQWYTGASCDQAHVLCRLTRVYCITVKHIKHRKRPLLQDIKTQSAAITSDCTVGHCMVVAYWNHASSARTCIHFFFETPTFSFNSHREWEKSCIGCIVWLFFKCRGQTELYWNSCFPENWKHQWLRHPLCGCMLQIEFLSPFFLYT